MPLSSFHHQFLESSCDTLRRVQTRPEHSQPKDRGALIAIVCALLLSGMVLDSCWKALIAHAQFVPAYAPSTNPVVLHEGSKPWKIGETRKVRFADGFTMQATYRGEIPFGTPPPSWVQVGDMFKYGSHFWVWMIVPGATKPIWVDP